MCDSLHIASTKKPPIYYGLASMAQLLPRWPLVLRNVSFAVGDIYLGKVKKLMPGLNAAFIDVGYKKDAFLHYLDLGPTNSTILAFCSKGDSFAFSTTKRGPPVGSRRYGTQHRSRRRVLDVGGGAVNVGADGGAVDDAVNLDGGAERAAHAAGTGDGVVVADVADSQDVADDAVAVAVCSTN